MAHTLFFTSIILFSFERAGEGVFVEATLPSNTSASIVICGSTLEERRQAATEDQNRQRWLWHDGRCSTDPPRYY